VRLHRQWLTPVPGGGVRIEADIDPECLVAGVALELRHAPAGRGSQPAAALLRVLDRTGPEARRGGGASDGPASDFGAVLTAQRAFRLPLVAPGTAVALRPRPCPPPARAGARWAPA
jgi:hypothetical protein